MIFDGVKAITIPEGTVKKIERNGNVLWQRLNTSVLVCEPVLSVAYAPAYKPSVGTNVLRATGTITGISETLIRSVKVKLQQKHNILGWMNYMSFSDASITKSDETTFAYVCDGSTGVVPTPSNYEMRIVAELTYTDLDGNTKTISTDIPYVKTW